MKEEKMKRKILSVMAAFGSLSLAAGTVSAQGQMPNNGPMKGGMMSGQGMTNCPMMSEDVSLMRDPDVKMTVTDSADGFTASWTSSNPDKAAALKKMAVHMKLMHSQDPSSAPATN